MWFTLYHMIRPNMSDQKGDPNTSYVIGYQNVPKHHRTQEIFFLLQILAKSVFHQFFRICSFQEITHNSFYDSLKF